LYDAGKYRAVVEHCANLIGRLPRFGDMKLSEILERGKGVGGEEFMAQVDAYARALDSLGCVAQAADDPRRAVGYLSEAIRVGAGDWNRHVNLGVAYYSLGMLDEAIEHWTIALNLPRHDNTPYFYLGIVNERIGNTEEAIRLYGKALWYQSDDIPVQERLAWILSTCSDARLRNGSRAVKLADAACKAVDYKSCELLNVLAAAHAECGLFDKAVGCQRRALELLHRGPDFGNATVDRAREYERRLDLYLRKEPCRTGTNSSQSAFSTGEN
jgi:tetratricopeptide (TPR) repeat protein